MARPEDHSSSRNMMISIICRLSIFVIWCLCEAVAGVNGGVGSVTPHCCELGRQWAAHSAGQCGPHPAGPVALVAQDADQTVACLAVIDICCLGTRRLTQCAAGRERALQGGEGALGGSGGLGNERTLGGEGLCGGLHAIEGSEDAKECCSCCQLGLAWRREALQPCTLPHTLVGSSPQCDATFRACCGAEGPEEGRDLPLYDLPDYLEGELSRLSPDGYEDLPDHGGRLPHNWSSEEEDLCETVASCDQLCANVNASWRCACQQGYRLAPNLRSCLDVDECTETVDTCSPAQRCINVMGGFECLDPPRSATKPPPSHTDPPSPGPPWRTPTSYSDPSSRVSPSAERCSPGFAWNRQTSDCEDVDECVLEQHNCTPAQLCLNSVGHFSCVTDDDDVTYYKLDDTDPDHNQDSSIPDQDSSIPDLESPLNSLVDDLSQTSSLVSTVSIITPVDVTTPHMLTVLHTPRPVHRMLTTAAQYYDATTPPAESLTTTRQRDGAKLVTNQTASARLVTNQREDVDTTPYTESLTTARKRDSARLVTGLRSDVDTTTAHGGHRSGTRRRARPDGRMTSLLETTTTSGWEEAVRQHCIVGLIYNSATQRCVDVDECVETPGICSVFGLVCENVIGSYRCTAQTTVSPSCRPGLTRHPFTFLCVDIDECRTRAHNCTPAQDCVNVVGSFQCVTKQCPSGYKLSLHAGVCQPVVCQRGMKADSSGHCVDVDECHTGDHNCGLTQDCVNVVGSFHCVTKQCPSGYKLSLHSGVCQPVVCQRGMKPDAAGHCADEDECHTGDHNCGLAQDCVNVVGSFQCVTKQCPPGYKLNLHSGVCQPVVCQRGMKPDAAGHCVDMDECHTGDHNCGLAQDCVNVVGSFQCVTKQCPPGYKLSLHAGVCQPVVCQRGMKADSSGHCVDVDECHTGDHNCGLTQDCVNVVGSFHCVTKQCPSGYKLSLHSGVCQPVVCQRGMKPDAAGHCVDMDECHTGDHNCGLAQDCVNVVGSFQCVTKQCPPGYKLSLHAGVCQPVVCQRGMKADPSGHCVDVDECHTGDHNCVLTQDCVNVIGSFHCVTKQCPPGYKLDSYSGACQPIVCPRGLVPDAAGNCIDRNECEERPGVCRSNERCRNTLGSYECVRAHTCGAGYELNEHANRCEDIDECARGTHDCRGTDINCVNRPGSYHCECEEGFQLNAAQRFCQDIDECQRSVCSREADCENTPGSFRCLCKQGFEADSRDTRMCNDVDECAHPGMCAHTCSNTWGSFRCHCSDGYQLAADNRSCTDVDECAVWSSRGSKLCQSECRNLPGSYVCTCPQGYLLSADSRSCLDVDECVTSEARCHGDGDVCTNTRGGYKCQRVNCPWGFTRANDGTHGVACHRKIFSCSQGDQTCLHTPLSYTVKFITTPTLHLRLPATLFTMQGPHTANRRFEFDLDIVDVRDPTTGRTSVNREFFHVEQSRPSEAVVRLVREVRGAQDVEMELSMRIYSREFRGGGEVFFGTAVAKIFLYLTDSTWL